MLDEITFEHDVDGRVVYINIFNINIATKGGINGGQQRAECVGQINKNVGTNANQGRHNAVNGSKSANNH